MKIYLKLILRRIWNILKIDEEGYKNFDNYMELKFYLEELIQRGIDLIIESALKPRLRFHILQEVIYVREKRL